MNSTRSKPYLAAIQDAEMVIRSLIAGSAQDGDYESVELGRQLAIELRQLIERFAETRETTPLQQVEVVPEARSSSPVRESSKADKSDAETGNESTFEVQGSHLLKIGWSKKKKERYVHKVSRAVFDQVVATLADLAAKQDGPVSAESLIKTLSSDERDPIPSYQVYVVIGFLRDRDVIQQLGRDGYTVTTNLKARARESWTN